jgi:hypothetical protein
MDISKEPIPLKAGDERVLVNGRPLTVDFRIISEERYQDLLSMVKNGLPDDCVHGWDEVKFCPVRQGDGWECRHCAN